MRQTTRPALRRRTSFRMAASGKEEDGGAEGCGSGGGRSAGQRAKEEAAGQRQDHPAGHGQGRDRHIDECEGRERKRAVPRDSVAQHGAAVDQAVKREIAVEPQNKEERHQRRDHREGQRRTHHRRHRACRARRRAAFVRYGSIASRLPSPLLSRLPTGSDAHDRCAPDLLTSRQIPSAQHIPQ